MGPATAVLEQDGDRSNSSMTMIIRESRECQGERTESGEEVSGGGLPEEVTSGMPGRGEQEWTGIPGSEKVCAQAPRREEMRHI